MKKENMKKRSIGIVILLTAIIIAGVIAWGMKQPEKLEALTPSQSGDQQADVILYFGQECSHCKNVEKFIADNKIEQKVIFARKEVWHNANNNDELQQRSKECVLDPEKVGVPFLYARGKCYIGEIDVENFFKKEAGIQ